MTTAKGGRPRSGEVKWMRCAAPPGRCPCRQVNGDDVHWHARVRLDDGRRPFVPLNPSIPHEDIAAAKASALEVDTAADRIGGTMGAAETAGQWFDRFYDWKEAKGLSTAGEMRRRGKKWVRPGIEAKPMRAVSREDIEAIVRRLDLAIAAFMKHGPGKGRLSPSTAANVWGDLQHAFDEATCSKDPSLRVLAESPCRNVRGPEGGDDRQGQILYSDELLALVRGDAADPDRWPVPLYRRQTYAMALYVKARSSELEALTAADVDLAHRTITIARQADRKSKGRKGTKATKTRRVRTVDIEPAILPLVEHLVKHPQGKGGRLLHMPPPEDRAELLRKDLHRVGVAREALHIERDPLQRAIVFHDLRDTGLTHMAVRGDSPIVIQWAGGHTDFKTTQGYIDRGRVEARRIGEPLPGLPTTLLDPSGGLATVWPQDQTDEPNSEESVAFLRPQRELNPCYRRERPVS
jgi:hypothetical protein